MRACTFLRYLASIRRVFASLAPASRRDAERPLEVTREMALIGETACRRDLRHRSPRAQRLKCAIQAHLVAPRVRRETRFASKKPRRMERRKPDRLHQFRQR